MVKKTIAVLGVLCLALTVCGQTEGESEAPAGPKKELGRPDMFIINLNHERLSDLSSDVDLEIQSRGIDIMGMLEFPIGTSKNFGFAGGLGFSSQNYFMDHWVRETDAEESFSDFIKIPDSLNISSYKLSTNQLTIPFELRFRSNPLKNGKRIKVAGGLKIGFMVNQHDKFKNDDGDKFKTYIFPNLKTWRFTVTGRIAYGKVGASMGYSLSSLFDDGRGPTVTPLSIGISIIPF